MPYTPPKTLTLASMDHKLKASASGRAAKPAAPPVPPAPAQLAQVGSLVSLNSLDDSCSSSPSSSLSTSSSSSSLSSTETYAEPFYKAVVNKDRLNYTVNRVGLPLYNGGLNSSTSSLTPTVTCGNPEDTLSTVESSISSYPFSSSISYDSSHTSLDTMAPPTAHPVRSADSETTQEEEAESDTHSVASTESGKTVRPNLVRKKSGELVKSSLKLFPLNRSASVPPTKSVHFDTNHMVDVRCFCALERPIAVSANSSPRRERPTFHWGSDDDSDEYYDDDSDEEDGIHFKKNNYDEDDETVWAIGLPNFPTKRYYNQEIYMDKLSLSDDGVYLVGNIYVRNIAFQKHVCAKYTSDYWKSVTEFEAVYNDDPMMKDRIPNYDPFIFKVRLDDLPEGAFKYSSMFMYLQYDVDGKTYYDNNNGYNYQIDLTKVHKSDNQENTRYSFGCYGPKAYTAPKKLGKTRIGDDFSLLNIGRTRISSDKIAADFQQKAKAEGKTDQKKKVEQPPLKVSHSEENISRPEKMFSDNPAYTKTFMKPRYTDFTSNFGHEFYGAGGNHDTVASSGFGYVHIPRTLAKSTSSSELESPSHSSTQKTDIPSLTKDGKRPQINSDSYKTLVESYCFYQGQSLTGNSWKETVSN